MTSPDYSEGVPRSVVLERKPAASIVADSDIRVGDLACSAADCQWASTNPALQGDGCPDGDCPGVFVLILDDPEPEPAPVEGAVERVRESWKQEAVRNFFEQRGLPVPEGLAEELERVRPDKTSFARLERLYGEGASAKSHSQLVGWACREIERLRSPKGGEPAT